nr:hypothetical protein [Tanacetum cinerariifolium]
LVNSSLKKLKFHLASFDMVIKERTTVTAITEGTWRFEHNKACFRYDIIPFVKALKELFNSFDQFLIDELSEVQQVFKKMEQAVEQHCVEKNKFQDKMKNVLKENDRLLTQALSVDIVNLVVHDNVKSACMNVDSLSGDVKERKVKREIEEIEMLNIELDHRVTKLVAENEHLKQTYKQLHTQEEAATHSEIIERVNLLSSASGSKSQDNTKNDMLQRTPRKAKKNKLEEHLRTVRPSLNKKSVVDTKATSSVTNCMSNVNFDLKCDSCNGCLFSDNHDACVVAYINYVNASIKSSRKCVPFV